MIFDDIYECVYLTDEDILYGAISDEEEEEEEKEKEESDDGLPKIGRQKAESDSDFQLEEDSGSDWEDKKKKVGSSLQFT